jgi:Protein of unknown function (DUF3159)
MTATLPSPAYHDDTDPRADRETDAGATTDRGPVTDLELPRPALIARRALQVVLVTTAIPMALFYVTLSFAGLRAAVLTGAAWYYLDIARRMIRRQSVPATVLVGALLITVRAVIAFMTGSVFIYFLQPTLGTVAVGGAFGVSALAGRPLARTFAQEYLPLTAQFVAHPRVAAFFPRVSLLWCAVNLLNATVTYGLLLSATTGQFLLLKSLGGPVLTGIAIVGSVVWFRRTMRGAGVRLRFSARTA